MDSADQVFQEEAKAHNLRFRCQDCAHIHPEKTSCTFGYPNDALRDLKSPVRSQDGNWVFCKFFELF